jgi:serine/threonine protein kinase
LCILHSVAYPNHRSLPLIVFFRVVAFEDVDQLTGLDASPLSIDDFDLLCTLGSGTWGKVFAARHKHTNITFALKIMEKQYLVEQKVVDHIIRERKIMSELLHPFILNLHGHFSTPTKLYMVMRLAPGGDISQVLARQEHNNFCFPSSVAQFVIAQVILAVEYMHGRGILHRDIKTENILIDDNGYCLLADMGFACYCEEVVAQPTPASTSSLHTLSLGLSLWTEPAIKKHENHLIQQRQGSTMRVNRSSFLGTPEYLAPELLNFKGKPNYGASADWWAVGILLYELLHGAVNHSTEFSKYDLFSRSNSIPRPDSGGNLRPYLV